MMRSASLVLALGMVILEFGEDDVLGVLTTEIGEVLPLVFEIEGR